MKIFIILFLGLVFLFNGCKKGTTEFQNNKPEIILWQPFTSSSGNTIFKVEIDTAGTIFASGVYGLFVSDDDGNTWQHIYNTIQPRDFSVSPIDGRILISAEGAFSGWIEYSSDRGKTWNNPSVFPGPALITSFLCLDNGSILCGSFDMEESNGGLLISNDGGNEWVESDLSRMISVQSLNKTAGYIFAGTVERDIQTGVGTRKIYRSSDNGLHWEALSYNEVERDIEIIKTDFDNNIYLGTYGQGIFRSEDDGETWKSIGLDSRKISSVIIDRRQIIYAACWDTDNDLPQSVYYSTDQGNTWIACISGLPDSRILTLQIYKDNYLLAGSAGDGLYISSELSRID